jgi:hypothetical protein
VRFVSGWMPIGAGAEPPEHTAEELADQVRVASYENEQMSAAIGACTQWISTDPRGFADYSGRVHAHSEKLPPILERAQTAIRQAHGAPGHYMTSKSYAEIIAWRSGLTALYREWIANPHGCALPGFSATPQPTAPDPGAAFLRETTPVAHAVDSTVDAAKRAAAAAGDTFSSRTPWVLGGAILGLAGLALLRRSTA